MTGRAVLGVALAMLATTAVLAVAGRPSADYRHGDFFQFWAAPRLLLEGADPYDPRPWADIYAREAAPPIAAPVPPFRFIYPPWVAVLLLPLGALPFTVAAPAWLAGQLAVVALAVRALHSLSGGARREAVLLGGFTVAFQPLWLTVGGGNMAGFLFGLLVAGVALVLERRAAVSGLALGLLAVKPHPFAIAGPALLAVAHPADRIRLIAGAALTGLALIAITLPFGRGLTGEWLASALELQRTSGSNATGWTLGRVLPGGTWVGPLLVGASIVALVAWWRARPHEPLTAVGAAVAISVFAAPHGWSYDQLLLLVPLAVIVGLTAVASGAPRIALLCAAAIIAGILPWLFYALAYARAGEEWSALTPLLVLGLLVVTERLARPA